MNSKQACSPSSPAHSLALTRLLRRLWGCRQAGLQASAAVLSMALLHPAPDVQAAPPALPVPCAGGACGTSTAPREFVSSGKATLDGSVPNTLIVNQTSAKAILNWESFNIGAGHSVQFKQPDAGAAALNRIYQVDPSRIAGALKANGQLYLINQNGILFGQGAQVNVNALVASSLNIGDQRFLQGFTSEKATKPVFTWEGDGEGYVNALTGGDGGVRVAQGAMLQAAPGGFVMLLAPQVTNDGTISTPEGQTVLAAGAKVYLAFPENGDFALRGFLVEVDPYDDQTRQALGGRVTNDAQGTVTAARGNISLVGLAVNQKGRVSATTSVNLNGSIRLVARDTGVEVDGSTRMVGQRTGTVTLGASSVTEVLPQLEDTTTSQDGTSANPVIFNRSRVDVLGHTIEMQAQSRISAPGGDVSLAAQQVGNADPFLSAGTALPGARIYLERGAKIDVAGTQKVAVSQAHDLIEVQLFGNELADAPLQRNGILYRQTVVIDAHKGTPLADVSGYIAQIGRTVGERTTQGGTVQLRAEGEVILRAGSQVDVSGGSIYHQGGYRTTTQLVSGGRRYDIGEAPPDLIYEEIIQPDALSLSGQRLSASLPTYTPAYTEGKDAGTIAILAPAAVLEGALLGTMTPGERQRAAGTLPKSGRLILGQSAAQTGQPDYWLPAVNFASRHATQLPAQFTFDTPLPASAAQAVELSAAWLRAGGFGRVAVYSNGRISVPQDVTVELDAAPGNALSLTGKSLDIQGDIVVPGGSVTLASKVVAGTVGPAAEYAIRVGANSTFSTRGQWVNDTVAGSPPAGPVVIHGGSIVLESVADLDLATGSLVDVSGGAWLPADGRLQTGNAGSIKLKTGHYTFTEDQRRTATLHLNGELRGYALGKGGRLTVDAAQVTLGTAPTGARGELWLTPSFFQQGGFRDYFIQGQDGVTLTAGTLLQPTVHSLVLSPTYAQRASGTDLLAFTSRHYLPDEQRPAANLTLAAPSKWYGDILLDQNALLRVDPGAVVTATAGRQITLLGTVEAPAGTIHLTLPSPTDTEIFNPAQAIWVGSTGRLLARGASRVLTDMHGRRTGEVRSGGTINLTAGKGYVVTAAGALLDVSGTYAEIDVRHAQGGRNTYVPTSIASDAGSIVITAREGWILDGTLQGHPGAGGTASGGSLSLAIERQTTPLIGGSFRTDVAEILVHPTGLPLRLTPGQVIDDAAVLPAGHGIVNAAAITAGGFDTLKLSALAGSERDSRIVFAEPATLALRRAVVLEASNLVADAATEVNLSAAYVALQGRHTGPGQTPQDAAPGTGLLNIRARTIDLIGQLATQGFGQVNLLSEGDIRAQGIWAGPALGYRGEFATAAQVVLRGDVMYPTSLSQYRFAVRNNPEATLVTVAGGGAHTVYSVGGQLDFDAPAIVHQGVVAAPFGRLALNAQSTLTLAGGSVVSVAAQDTLPLGHTDFTGKTWVYGSDATARLDVEQALPHKEIRLHAARVDQQPGARVEVSGGGDIVAYEFIKGPGGSKDVLLPEHAPTTYAILPGFSADHVPHDNEYFAGIQGWQPGDGVYLSGAPGLPAGTYAKLPARYALLPGAYLVTSLPGYRDLTPSQTARLPDGTTLVAGYEAKQTFDGRWLQGGHSAGYSVRPGHMARTQAQYLETFGSTYFKARGMAIPDDAGRVALEVTQALRLAGDLRFAHAGNGNSGELDIAAPKLAVRAPGGATVDEGYITLDAQALSAFEVGSLLLGGTRRSQTDGTTLTVRSSEVVVANTAATPLAAAEVILTATDSVTLRSGSVIAAQQGRAPAARALQVVNHAGSDADGALLRVANGPAVTLARLGNAQRVRGSLQIETGASLVAGGSLDLDATHELHHAGTLTVAPGGYLSLGAPRIGLGALPPQWEGLALDTQQLAQWQDLGGLGLRSYRPLELWGAVALGNAKLDLTLQAPGLVGINNRGVHSVLTARTLTLGNPTPSAEWGDAVPSHGTLQVQAQQIVLGAGMFQTQGYDTVAMTGSTAIIGRDQGGLQVSGGDLSLITSRLSAQHQAHTVISADGAVDIALPAAPVTALPSAGLGARLDISGRKVRHAGIIDLPSGTVNLTAWGSTAQDGVRLSDGAMIRVAGVAKIFGTGTAMVPGGNVGLHSARGDIELEAGTLVELSAATGGTAGSLNIRAPQGRLIAAGTLRSAVIGSPSGAQGSFNLDVGQLSDFSALNRSLAQAGFSAALSLRVRQGDIVVADGDIVTAQHVSFATDHGIIRVSGTVDASGDQGGYIALQASGAVVLHEGALLDAYARAPTSGLFGTAGRGGTVLLATTATRVDEGIDLQAGSRIDVSRGAGAAGRDGRVTLRAPRLALGENAPDIAIKAVAGEIVGAGEIVIEGVQIYQATTLHNSGATVAGENFNTSTSGTAFQEATAFMAAQTTLARLGWTTDSRVQLRPGVEIQSTADLRLQSDWDLTGWRVGDTPFALTLRAQGDLQIDATLSDGIKETTDPRTKATTTALRPGASSRYQLVAGADLAAVDAWAVALGAGDVKIASGKAVRSGTGAIHIAAGRHVIFGEGARVYTAGVPDDTKLPGFLAPTADPRLNMPVYYPTQGGDIEIRAQADIQGTQLSQSVGDWLFRRQLFVGNALTPNPQTSWWPSLAQFSHNVGALGGGDVRVTAGGDVRNLGVVVPTSGRLGGERNVAVTDPAALQVLGGGDITVHAGRDIYGGLYYVAAGAGRLTAAGSLRTSYYDPAVDVNTVTPLNAVVGLGAGTFTVHGGGAVALETVYNPTMAPHAANNRKFSNMKEAYFFSYSPTSAVHVTAAGGDVLLAGRGELLHRTFGYSGAGTLSAADVFTLLPGTLTLAALHGDVTVGTPEGSLSLGLYPSSTGTVELLADRSVHVYGRINLSDVNPATLAHALVPLQAPAATIDVERLSRLILTANPHYHSDPPLHGQDNGGPVLIHAAQGDIVAALVNEPVFGFAKAATLHAGRDIINGSVYAQHARVEDVTFITAGRDLIFKLGKSADGTLSVSGTTDNGIHIGGPGRVDVLAGRDIDLGASGGIITHGNTLNPYLPSGGARIYVQAGAAVLPDYADFIAQYILPAAPAADSVAFTAYMNRVFPNADGRLLSAAQALEKYHSIYHPSAGAVPPQEIWTALTHYVNNLPPYNHRAVPLSTAEALQILPQLPSAQQSVFVTTVFFDLLKHTAKAAATAGGKVAPLYAPGYNAIAALFPPQAQRRGDISLFFSQIKTEQGGAIGILAPYGMVNAGLSNPGSNAKSPADLGVVTLGGGDVNALTRGDFLVNQSRVFTVMGGDILMWSSQGNIDAGKGAKTANATPPPRLIFDPKTNTLRLDTSQSIAGSGIGVLLGNPTIMPGDVYLVAPQGEISTGDAGIRAAGTGFIAALRTSSDGFSFGEGAVGIVDMGALSSNVGEAGSAAAGSSKESDELLQQLAASSAQPASEEFRPSLLKVEVISFGDEGLDADEPAPSNKKRRARKTLLGNAEEE